MTRELPSGWVMATVGDVAQFVRGVTYSKEHASKAAAPGFIAVLRANNIGHGLNFDDLVFVPDRFVSDEQVVRDGDVVLAMSSGSKSVVGKAAVAMSPPRCGFGAFCGVIRPSDFISHSLLGYYFQTKAYRNAVSEESKGVNINNLKAEHILERPLPIPPLAEQERVASKTDELFSRIEEGERALERVQKLVEHYRQSVLKAATSGELTRNWREKNKGKVESGETLLARILKVRRESWETAELEKMKDKGITPGNDKWKQRYKEPPFARTTDLPELPDGWVWATVEQLSTKVVDGVHNKPSYVASGIPFVTVKNLTAGPGISFEKLNYITREDHAAFSKRTDPERGDVLVSKDGTLGVTRVVQTDVVFSIFVSVALVKPVVRGMGDYLGVALSSPVVQAQMVPKGSGLQHIHLEDLRQDCVPLPSQEEQQRIAELVAAQMASVDHIEADLAARREQSNGLRQSVLSSAFAGSLLPQDPTDEPAATLLERVAAERHAHSAPKRSIGRKSKTNRAA